jgi:hypothetical protein
MVHQRRAVSRAAYRELVDALPKALPSSPSTWTVAPGAAPVRAARRRGRRGETAPNAVRPVRGW